MMHVSDSDILSCLPFFLSGMAQTWYRGQREHLTTWPLFKTAWRRRFGNREYQFALRDEIMHRTQGEHESVLDYFTCMNALFDRLSPQWSDEEKVGYAHRNLQPRLQIMIRYDDARNIRELEWLAEDAERRYEISQRFRAPPTPEKSLFPALAYRPPAEAVRTQRSRKGTTLAALYSPGSSKAKTEGGSKTPKKKSSTESDSANAPTTCSAHATRNNDNKCWNCAGTGHFSRDCTEPRKVHCYSCGKPEVTVRTCSTCTEKQNVTINACSTCSSCSGKD